MKYLILILFPLCIYSQNYLQVDEPKGKEVRFELHTEIEYANLVTPFYAVVLDKAGKVLDKAYFAKDDERCFTYEFFMDFEEGTYRVMILTVNNEFLTKSKYFTIGHINDRQ